MPSGFTQNTNQLIPSYYRVVVTMTGYFSTLNTTPNKNGAITPNEADSFATLPSTLLNGSRRARGNMRFRNVVNQLSNLADCQLLDIVITDTVADDQPSGDCAFTVKFDRAIGILPSYSLIQKANGASANGTFTVENITYTAYNAINGSTAVNTNVLAITDAVARAINLTTSASARVYNGDIPEGQQLPITVEAPDTASNIFSSIAVTQIDGTQLAP